MQNSAMKLNFLRIWLDVLIVLKFSSTVIAVRKLGFQKNVIAELLFKEDIFYLMTVIIVFRGYVCDAMSVDPQSRCCPMKGEKFSCQGCNSLSCCNSYEYCVTCCLSPARTVKEQVLKVKIAKPSSSGTYASVFDYCTGRCRHNSESVVHENAYISDFHHCFSLPSNSSGPNSTLLEARLNGINVVVGRQGESCNLVCKARGQSCVPYKLSVLNQCDIIQKHMNCKEGCLASVGPDQPAEVVPEAPKHLNPGSCLYTQSVSMLSCDGLHQHTRRLCPCA